MSSHHAPGSPQAGATAGAAVAVAAAAGAGAGRAASAVAVAGAGRAAVAARAGAGAGRAASGAAVAAVCWAGETLTFLKCVGQTGAHGGARGQVLVLGLGLVLGGLLAKRGQH